ncbi:MAG TPA: RagB/SusD family nutrient uptake outer membrane protein [Longimicrobiaceae bacterium]|nr:RagB/SusD family nutrient uptake outer membrane protein [Longimicrobiaceae bacterium]
MKHNRPNRARVRPRGALRGALWLVAALSLAACDSLLDVEAPSRIPAEALDDPSTATLLLSGAIGDFECAFQSYVVMGGIVGEELVDATQTADRWPYDRRSVDPSDRRYGEFACTALGVYTPLSTARWAAENALAKLQGWTDAEVPNRGVAVATAAAYSGYSHLLLGEGFCSGVLLDETLEAGAEVPRADVLRRAVARFDQAVTGAQAAGSADILNMALVGRARAKLDLGDRAGAAADARLVTANYAKTVTASTIASRRENRVVEQNNNSQAVTIGPSYRNLAFGGVADPRVRVTDSGRNATDGNRIWVQTKYATLATGIPLATWDEAQLIIAEVEGGASAVNIINAFHTRAGLPAFASTDAAAIQAQVVEERRRELFLESHHLGDIIRYNLALTPATGTAFPKGGTYGSTTCLPLPNIEKLNNRNISG